MREFERRVLPHLPWMQGRARLLASRYGSAHGGVEALAEDILQGGLLRAVRRAPDWFNGPSVNEEARMRELLSWCLMQAATSELRARKGIRLVSNDESGGSEPPHEAAEVGEGTLREQAEEEVIWNLDGERERETLMAYVREALNPSLRLSILAILFPKKLTFEDVLAASRFRSGGARPVSRDPKEAWSLFIESAEDPRLVGHPAKWKRRIAEIFRLDSPLGAATKERLQVEVNTLDLHLSRARVLLLRKHREETMTGGSP